MQASDSMQLLSFTSTAHRVLHRYIFSFADFLPIESDTVSADAQQVFYEFCKSIVQNIADTPTRLGLSVDLPDQWLGAHDTMNMYPDIYKVRNDCQKAFVDMAHFLFCAGQFGVCKNSQLTVTKTDLPKMNGKQLGLYRELFSNHGLMMTAHTDALSFEFPSNPHALSAWKLYSEISANEQTRPRDRALGFILWMNGNDGSYFLERIRSLLDLEECFFQRAAEAYRAKGYDAAFRIDEYRTIIAYSKAVSGLSIEFSTLWPTVRFVNESSIGIKATLEHADGLEDEMLGQLIRFCKPCNDCMGCTKGEKNRQFTVVLQHDNDEYRVCPEFVQMEWYNRDISMEKIEFLLALNELQEKFGKKPQRK